jgi:hypothetical protein
MTLKNKIYCWRLYLNLYSNKQTKNFNQIKLDNIVQISMSEQTCYISEKITKLCQFIQDDKNKSQPPLIHIHHESIIFYDYVG